MSKLKVRCTKAEGNRFIVGKVYEFDENGRLTDELGHVGNTSLTGTFEEWHKDCNWTDYDFEPVPPRHSIHITCTDNKTTHAVKKVDGKIVARSMAVCCSADEFNANIGAQLAFNRLVYGTDHHPSDVAPKPEQPKQEDKHTYKAGDRVKATRLEPSGEVGTVLGYAKRGTHFDCDVLVEFDSPISGGHDGFGDTDTRGKQGHCYYCFEKWLEPYTEPKPEPVKLYCVEDYSGFTTKGKVYEFTDGNIRLDDGCFMAEVFTDYADFVSHNRGIALCLVPLVSREAKVGEWVYVLNKSNSTYKPNKIYKVYYVNDENSVYFASDCKGVIKQKDYLVLDGYKPEPEKAEPEYLNMKVICVAANTSRWFTTGKVYEVRNGVLNYNGGEFDYNPLSPAKTLEQLNVEQVPRFIEFKGE